MVRRDGPLEIRRAVRLGLQIAEGLEAAHLAGVVHRDIKPDNIMVLRQSSCGRNQADGLWHRRMMDSGNTANLTRTGVIMGTPAYMAPEQAEGAEMSERTDIYATPWVSCSTKCLAAPFRSKPARVRY